MYSGNIILLGLPGSGKGTLAENIIKNYDYDILSAGDILRNEKNSGTKLGLEIKSIIGKGNLLPDELINDIMYEHISNSKKFVLDGYPRTIEQANYLNNITDIGMVIFLDIEENLVIKRILERGKTSEREDDQSIDIINNRLLQYKNQTYPLVEYFSNKGILHTINSSDTKEEVFNNFNMLLNSI